MEERKDVIMKLALYFDVEPTLISTTILEYDSGLKVYKFSRKRKEVEARWCYWCYLNSTGMSPWYISQREGFNHKTIYHALENVDIVLNEEIKGIIYGTDI